MIWSVMQARKRSFSSVKGAPRASSYRKRNPTHGLAVAET